MGLLGRIFGDKLVARPDVASPPRTVTIKRPGEVIEAKVVEDDGSTFGDWVADMKTKSSGSSSAPRVKKVTLEEDTLRVLDLSDLPSTRMRIVGSAYWVSDAERGKFGGTAYLLAREPENKHDPSAVAVYGRGRKVGYLTAAKAAALASIVDSLPFDAFRVGGISVMGNSVRLWVDVPSVPALRKFAETHR